MRRAQNADTQSSMTPERALEALVAGNARFQESRPESHDFRRQVEETSGGQWPFAVVLGCIDSRASAELIFDAGIGDLFSVRVAGNFVNDDILGSIEFGCQVAGSKLVVVMGHTHCGAVKGACDDVKLGHLTGMLANIKPAIEAIPAAPEFADKSSQNAAFVQAVAEKNVALTIDLLREKSDILRGLEESGAIRIVGAMYDVGTGAVTFAT